MIFLVFLMLWVVLIAHYIHVQLWNCSHTHFQTKAPRCKNGCCTWHLFFIRFWFFFLMNPFHKNAYRFYVLTFYFSWNDHLYGLLMNHEQVLVFYFEKGSKGDPNSEILYILLFNTWNSKTRQMSKIQWVQHITVSNSLLCQAK